MAGSPDRAFAHLRISEERRTPSPFPTHKPDLRVDLSSINIPSPPQPVAPPSNVIPISSHHVVLPTNLPRPSPQMPQEPPSIPSVVSPRLSPRAAQAEKNNKFTFHFPPPIMNPFGGSVAGTPTQYQLDSALPARGEQTVIFFPMVNPPPTPPTPAYGSPASPQLSPRGPRTNKPEGGGRARALTEGPPISPRGSSSSSQSSNPTSPRNRRANSLSPQKPHNPNPPYSVIKMRVHAGKLEDASKPRAGRHRRGPGASPQSPLDASEALPESDPALDLPFPAPPGLFQICQPDTHPDLVPSVAEEVPLNFLEDVDEAFLKQALPGLDPPMPLPLVPMDTGDIAGVTGAHAWYPPAAAEPPVLPPPPQGDDFWAT